MLPTGWIRSAVLTAGGRQRIRTAAANLTFTAEELKVLDVESSKFVELEKFVAGDDIDPVTGGSKGGFVAGRDRRKPSPKAR